MSLVNGFASLPQELTCKIVLLLPNKVICRLQFVDKIFQDIVKLIIRATDPLLSKEKANAFIKQLIIKENPELIKLIFIHLSPFFSDENKVELLGRAICFSVGMSSVKLSEPCLDAVLSCIESSKIYTPLGSVSLATYYTRASTYVLATKRFDVLKKMLRAEEAFCSVAHKHPWNWTDSNIANYFIDNIYNLDCKEKKLQECFKIILDSRFLKNNLNSRDYSLALMGLTRNGRQQWIKLLLDSSVADTIPTHTLIHAIGIAHLNQHKECADLIIQKILTSKKTKAS